MLSIRVVISLMLVALPFEKAIAVESDVSDSVEVIEVLGQRNDLRSNRLVANNSTFTLVDTNLPNVPTVADSLAQVPGVSLNGQGGLFQSYSIRGFSRWRIMTEVDGIPIITDRRAGNSASFIPSALLSGFDVQKGPSSTLYGSDAIGGAINLKTINFEERFISFSGQSIDQTKEFTGAFGTQHWQTALNYRHSNNAENGDGVELNTGLEQFTVMSKVRFKHDGLEGKVTWIPSIGKDIGKSASTYPEQRITVYPKDKHSLFLAEITDQSNWYAKAYHHYQNWDSDVTRVNSRRNLTEYQGHTLGANLITSHSLLDGEMRIGLDWINRQGVSIKDTEFDINDQRQFSKTLVDGQQHNAAIFSDIHWQFDKFAVSSGIRYDYISQRQFIRKEQKSDHALNANLLFNYQPQKNIKIQTELATGFRFPTLTELYFDGQTPRGTTIGNPNLSPEQSKGLQLSINLSPSPALDFSISSYYYMMDDYIERYSVDDETTSYRNLNEATIFGLESAFRWTPSNQWAHDLSFQWQQGEDQDDTPISDIQAPHWKLSTHWYHNNLAVTQSLTYRVEKHAYSGEEQKLQSLFNWNISIKASIYPSTDITLWGSNLLDRVVPATADENSADIVGRNIGLKLSHHF